MEEELIDFYFFAESTLSLLDVEGVLGMTGLPEALTFTLFSLLCDVLLFPRVDVVLLFKVTTVELLYALEKFWVAKSIEVETPTPAELN